MTQILGSASGNYVKMINITSMTPGSVLANTNTAITQAGVDIAVGEFGICFLGTPATNAVVGGHVFCTTAGTASIRFLNPTVGALTPTPASVAAPYVLVLYGQK